MAGGAGTGSRRIVLRLQPLKERQILQLSGGIWPHRRQNVGSSPTHSCHSHRVANEDDDKKWSEHGAATYEPWQSVLDQWDEPARTREGAIEALRAALSEEDGVYGTDAAHCMVKAALGYLEGVRA